jgi:hypothetical protein
MRVTDFARLAASRPVNRQAAEVVPLAAEAGAWSGVILDLTEQLALATSEVQRLRQQLTSLGYPTPLTTRQQTDHRRQLTRQLEHYEAVALDLRRELRRANRVTKPATRQAPRTIQAAPAPSAAADCTRSSQPPEGALQAALRRAGLA